MNVDAGKMDEMDSKLLGNMAEPKLGRGPNFPRRPPNAGKGRPAGVPNKATKALKDMILGALASAGGEDWLLEQARINPTTFMNLIGKVLPSEINLGGKDGERLAVDVHFLGNMYK